MHFAFVDESLSVVRLYAVTMVRNEADVIEAFVRHNLQILDGLAVVDHGSFDGTSEILAALQAEGLPFTVERDDSPEFFQSARMTRLVRETLARERADYVFALDADEFLKCPSRELLERALAQVPLHAHALARWLTYVPETFDDDVPFGDSDLRWRLRLEKQRFDKAIVRARFGERASEFLAMGNHSVGDRSNPAVSHARLRDDVIAIAHCPVRSRRQMEAKIAIGYLAYIATRKGNAQRAYHWRDLYEELRAGATLDASRLRQIATNYGLPRAMWEPAAQIPLVEDPVTLGFDLRYDSGAVTQPFQLLLRFVETLIRRGS